MNRKVFVVILLAAASCFGQTWTRLSPSNRPPAVHAAASAYDVKNGKLVLFGGDPGGNETSNQTWLWDGTTWTRALPATSPSARRWHAMAYDEVREQIVLFGGSGYSDTWVWDGSNWIEKNPATTPPGRSAHAMAFDPVRLQIILFGGFNGFFDDDTWAWDGNTWHLLAPPMSPGVRYYHSMVHDAARGEIVLFGGGGSDTWIWTGVNWTMKTPVTSPPGRLGAAMVYHAASRRTILFGGYMSSFGPSGGDTWSWDGVNWTQLAPLVSPEPRTEAAAAYDAPREKLLLFGGTATLNDPLGDTWTFAPSAGCAFSSPPPEISVSGAGGAGSVPIQITAGCPWSAKSNSDWISLTNATGTGSGTVTFVAQPNDFPLSRPGFITVNGRQYIITQLEPPCPSSGGPLTNAVIRNGCTVNFTYTAKAGDGIAIRGRGRGVTYGPRDNFFASYPSIQVTGPAPGNTLVGSATYRSQADASADLPETGVLVLKAAGTYIISMESFAGGPAGGSSFTVLKSGQPCVIDPAYVPNSIDLTADGGDFTGELGLPPGCTPIPVTASAPWIKPSKAAIQPGFSRLSVSIEPNYGLARSGSVTIGTLKTQISQPASTCTYSLDGANVNAPASGLSTAVSITVTGTCRWTVGADASWVQPYPLTGSGSSSVQYNIFPNFSTRSRTLVMTVAGRPFTIIQAGAEGTAMQRYVQLLYFAFFGRLPSPAEIDFHANSQPPEHLASNFYNTEEFNIGGRFVAGLYVGLLNRDAEYAGWLFQRNALATQAVNRNDLVSNFIGSAEYVLRFGLLDNRAYVTLLYRHVLLREPSASEVDFQAAALAGGVTRVQLGTNFLNSLEFRIGTGPRLTAFLLYATLLQRDPTPAEFAAAVAQASSIQQIGDLNARRDAFRTQMIAPILNNAEFAAILQ